MKITEHDAITNITEDRDMTTAELKQVQADKLEDKAALAADEAKATAKAALLDRMGLTADEAALLLS